MNKYNNRLNPTTTKTYNDTFNKYEQSFPQVLKNEKTQRKKLGLASKKYPLAIPFFRDWPLKTASRPPIVVRQDLNQKL